MRLYVISGGTMVHVSPHFALCAPAFGKVGQEIAERLSERDVMHVRTSMASGADPSERERALFSSAGLDRLETNDDLASLLDHLVSDPDTGGIVLAAAVCDWVPVTLELGGETQHRFGKSVPRLRTAKGDATIRLTPSDKLITRIREQRKDLLLVAFKATAGLESRETRARGFDLLERTGATLVLANDVQRNTNVVVTKDEAFFGATREEALDQLAGILMARSARIG